MHDSGQLADLELVRLADIEKKKLPARFKLSLQLLYRNFKIHKPSVSPNCAELS